MSVIFSLLSQLAKLFI